MTKLYAVSLPVDCNFGGLSVRGSVHASETTARRGCLKRGWKRKDLRDKGLQTKDPLLDVRARYQNGVAQPMAQPMARRWHATTTTRIEHQMWFLHQARARLRQRPKGLACRACRLKTKTKTRLSEIERSSLRIATSAVHREQRRPAMARRGAVPQRQSPLHDPAQGSHQVPLVGPISR